MANPIEAVTIEARRARVAAGLVARASYRDLASELGVALGTIAGDVTHLRKAWAKTYGKADQVFDQASMDLDAWQGQLVADLPNLPPDQRPTAVNTLVRINDQRNRLFGLYPRPGDQAAEIPTGPITVELRIIPEGNRTLITDGAEDDEPDDGRDPDDLYKEEPIDDRT